MYFWTILLLLFVSKYIYCVPPREARNFPQEELIPFTLEYSTEAELFLYQETHDFYVTLMGKIRMGITSIISSNFYNESDNKCVTEYTTTPPAYRLAENGDRECLSNCITNNQQYVQFMNQHISFMIENLFTEPIRYYRVNLNAIDSQTGKCVRNDHKEVYECECTTNYQIKISRSLFTFIEQLINNRVTARSLPEIDEYLKGKRLAAFMILLKFHPVTAPLFLGYIFRQFRLCLENYASVNLSENAPPDLSGNVRGLIDDNGEFIEYDEKLFKRIMKKISSTDSRDLRAMVDPYFEKCTALKSIILSCLGVIVIEGVKKFKDSYSNSK